ncbi:MAG: bifunctional DNA-formamidopyrimidine glycosylase/DNA-(apurinic or apyrimidinic site) lyase [candidate division WOR-3 bacterium]
MPELPEVETIRSELAKVVVGRTVRAVVVGRPDIIGFPSVRQFTKGVVGRKITGMRRIGKYLVLELENGDELIFHLRLSGHLEIGNGRSQPRFERARFMLSGGATLSFVEPRALGRVYLVNNQKYPRCLAGMVQMGPEPIAPDFTAGYLAARLEGRKASIKSLLLDQRVCCGVGNIYSDEALFRAGIRPTRRAGSLCRAEVARLCRSLRSVLRDGIRWCGTTLKDGRYLRTGAQSGRFQRRLKVVGRAGELCRAGCGAEVRRLRFGNRSSYFCPKCQH